MAQMVKEDKLKALDGALHRLKSSLEKAPL